MWPARSGLAGSLARSPHPPREKESIMRALNRSSKLGRDVWINSRDKDLTSCRLVKPNATSSQRFGDGVKMWGTRGGLLKVTHVIRQQCGLRTSTKIGCPHKPCIGHLVPHCHLTSHQDAATWSTFIWQVLLGSKGAQQLYDRVCIST